LARKLLTDKIPIRFRITIGVVLEDSSIGSIRAVLLEANIRYLRLVDLRNRDERTAAEVVTFIRQFLDAAPSRIIRIFLRDHPRNLGDLTRTIHLEAVEELDVGKGRKTKFSHR